jgi:glycosyltransferase involved in cell wall biosynthesis
VSEEVKYKELSSSWSAIQPSSKEGWGITVIESNIVGTPVIASNVSGLRDAIKNKETGLLFEYDNINDLTNLMLQIVNNSSLRDKLSKNAIVWANNFRWDMTASKLETLVSHEISLKRKLSFKSKQHLNYISEPNN